jgi:DNA polymerase-3 subunit delta'
VRFEAPSAEELAASVQALGVAPDTALACARLSLGDGERARELAAPEGQELRAGAEAFARTALAGRAATDKPWLAMLAGVRARGEATTLALAARAEAEAELYPRKEQKRVLTEWSERIRRARRRVETGALDLALQVVSLWYEDLACLAWGAEDLIRNCDRLEQLRGDAGPEPRGLQRAVELVEDTRMRFQLNVSEELACEALAYRLERVLANGA